MIQKVSILFISYKRSVVVHALRGRMSLRVIRQKKQKIMKEEVICCRAERHKVKDSFALGPVMLIKDPFYQGSSKHTSSFLYPTLFSLYSLCMNFILFLKKNVLNGLDFNRSASIKKQKILINPFDKSIGFLRGCQLLSLYYNYFAHLSISVSYEN